MIHCLDNPKASQRDDIPVKIKTDSKDFISGFVTTSSNDVPE